MDLNSSLSIATSGLEATQYALGVVSQNVSNASTTGYVEEISQVSSRDSAGVGSGVSIGLTTRNVNNALMAGLYTQNASVAALTATSDSLSSITALQGSTSATSGSSNTLSDLLGNISNDFTALVSNPTSDTERSTVISDAQTLTSTINSLSNEYQTQRQNAQDTIVTSVSDVNTDLTTIGALSQQIMKLQVTGASVADLENQRASAMSDLSSKISVTFTETSTGDMLVKTADGTELPTQPSSSSGVTIPTSTWPLSTESASVDATSSYPGTTSGSAIPDIELNGTDITTSLTGGTLGANIQLRDSVYPTMQAQLDSFSYTLANRFNAAGLTLFTDGTGSMPSSSTTAGTPDGIVGLASTLEVNPDIVSDTSQLSPNGSTTLASAVLSTALGSATNDVSGTLSAPSSGLGMTGTLSTGYSSTLSLANLATTLTSAQAQVASTASSSLTTATSVQTSLSTQVSNVSGVNVDDEMSKIVALQNAYTANAKIVTTVQSMFTALLDAIN
ncbi:flagellar hook-associated protein FlgK [Acetobacter sacchari]|uniref:Flagellar hook-associated protein 1 n=1 Tax=Acetobacter sacchari TaxID=2661687 RepID=A0ABS3LYD8_9PROT|nr:flagellar hook-associated protein FlgK [Acetobacter sacchari]MBO1360871.1 flagellar hook-associated protein FlgK [Acetobacter sacchari]